MKAKPRAMMSPYDAARIENFDVQGTTALRGYWKCNDGGSTVRDYSKYGNHLTVELSGAGFTADTMWSNKPGWMSVKNHDRARVQINDSLTLGSKFVVLACDIENENGLSDCDFGTSWNSNGIATETYRGISLGAIWGVIWIRTAEYIEGGGNGGRANLYTREVGYSGEPLLTPIGVAGAWRPGVSLTFCSSGELRLSEAVTTSALEEQENTFAIAAARNAGYEDVTGYTAVRNYQLWAFDSEPPLLDETLKWMSANPGLLPWWWAGR